jgi:hypothetical protein
VALEQKGIHTVTVVWDTFEKAARGTARIKGMPGAKFVVTPRQGSRRGRRDRAAVAGLVNAAHLLPNLPEGCPE